MWVRCTPLEQYADEIQHMAEALKSTGVDAEKKPAGFKELQISLRETSAYRRFDPSLPVDKRPFFRSPDGLVKSQNELIDELFRADRIGIRRRRDHEVFYAMAHHIGTLLLMAESCLRASRGRLPRRKRST